MKNYHYLLLLINLTFFSCFTSSEEITLPPDDPFVEAPSLKAVKSATILDDGDGVLGLNDIINYTITIQNTGNVSLTEITIVDTFTDLAGTPLLLSTQPIFLNSESGSSEGDLVIGETATYTASYNIGQNAIDAGGVSNSVQANGISPTGTSLSDISDNGDDTDGNNSDDPTITLIP